LDNGLDQRLLDPLSPEARELRAKGIFPVDVRLEFVFSGRWPAVPRLYDTRPADPQEAALAYSMDSVVLSFDRSRLYRDSRISLDLYYDLISGAIDKDV